MDDLYEKVMIGGEDVAVKLTDVPLALVDLDAKNPRIQYRMLIRPKDKTLDDMLMELPGVPELKKDILLNGGIRERPFVQATNGRFLSVEGNCRIVCLRSLAREYVADARWQNVRVRLLPEDFSERKKSILLSDLHVSGKIRWQPHEQAGHIYRMHKEQGFTIVDIATMEREKNKQKVQRLLDVYEFLQRFLAIDNGRYREQGEGKWSTFQQFFTQSVLRKKFEADEEFGNEFCRWVGDKRIPDTESVSRLALIAQHDESWKCWKQGGSIDDCMKIIESIDPSQKSKLFKTLVTASKEIDDLSNKEMQEIAAEPRWRQKLQAHRDAVEALIGRIGSPRQAAE